MCTVIIQVPDDREVPEGRDGAIRLLAVRDESPERAWDPLGPWWPELPGVVGVRDRRAGGAWLTIRTDGGSAPGHPQSTHSLAVILNRGEPVGEGGTPLESRGRISLDAVNGTLSREDPHTASFNLVHIEGAVARLTRWNGHEFTTEDIGPGVHMIAHTDLDDLNSSRIAQWLPAFREATLEARDWRSAWVGVLQRSTEVDAADDRAIIRDNRPYGIPTLSLYAVMAELTPATTNAPAQTRAWHAHLPAPGEWGGAAFEPVAI